MYIQAFPISVTNVFPMVNSVNGGQLATEFNLRSRESVSTDSAITYMVGPTYVHSASDFSVSIKPGTSNVLLIGPGRALINGHFVQTLADVEIDLPAAVAASGTRLSGNLAIGIRMMYADTLLSGSATPLSAYAGSLEPEDNTTQMYKGIQVVILPQDQFKLPTDSPTDESQVTAHLKLATFRYTNGVIRGNIAQTPFSENGTVLSAERIKDIDDLLEGQFITHQGLAPNKIYTYAGKPIIQTVDNDPQTVVSRDSTWCDSTDSIMVWDRNPQSGLSSDVDASQYGYVAEAQFLWNANDNQLKLVVPHKQIDGGMIEDPEAASQRYKFYPRAIPLPTASLTDSGSYGIVDSNYTNAILNRFNEMDSHYLFAGHGTQFAYVPQLNTISELPALPSVATVSTAFEHQPFDYVLVGQDFTQVAQSDSSRSPATVYQVLQYCDTFSDTVYDPDSGEDPPHDISHPVATISQDFPDVESADRFIVVGGIRTLAIEAVQYYNHAVSNDAVKVSISVSGVEYVVRYLFVFYVRQQYSEPIWITGTVNLATENTVGGFRNVAESEIGQGYVYLDTNGHLRVLDYTLLASGALAYQLGHDISLTNLTFDALQTQLNEYVNERVAFPDQTQVVSTAQAIMAGSDVDASVINVTIELPDDSSLGDSETQILNIYDIDSRFGASIYLHITGNATNKTILNILNCQKLRIDNNISGSPVLMLSNCELYYDAVILDYATSEVVGGASPVIRSNITGLSLWYKSDASQTDPQLVVDGMTVYQKNVALSGADIDAFGSDYTNDVHFTVGLDSITLDTFGDVVGCGIAIQNGSTANNQEGESALAVTLDFPQGSPLVYPIKHMVKPISINGSFSVCYNATTETDTHVLQNTNLTLITSPYDAGTMQYASNVPCTIFLNTNVVPITPVIYRYGTSVDPEIAVIDGVKSDDIHIFSGKVTS